MPVLTLKTSDCRFFPRVDFDAYRLGQEFLAFLRAFPTSLQHRLHPHSVVNANMVQGVLVPPSRITSPGSEAEERRAGNICVVREKRPTST